MNNDLFNILSKAKDIDQQKLLDYMQDKLSPEERYEIERLLIDADFESDAAEGLSQIKNKKRLPLVMSELNRRLIKKLSKRRKHSLNKPGLSLMIPVVTTIIILFLIMMFYLLLKRYF
ncbi:MAG: hypothetical protein JST63_14755 [Bacteroidetes bacterium]|nr:hypothetical protein [Bacteroidota bacterium]